MDIAHLKTFLEIYRIRHFGKAAEKLFITQSAASARIKILEDKLGVSLFLRNKRMVEPTAAAHRFVKYAEMSVLGWEQACQVIALPDDFQQSLAVGCLADIWHLFLIQWLDDIKLQFPALALNLTIQPTSSISEQLISRALDVGFVFEPVHAPNLEIQEITTLQLKLFSSDPEITLENAWNENFIMIDWGASFLREFTQTFRENPLASIQTNYGSLALDILKSRGGTAYLPEQVALGLDDSMPLYEVVDAPHFKRQLYAVFHQDTDISKHIKEIIQLLTDKVSD